MKRDLEALTRGTFDLLVIGGGIHGAATAREAALRGLKVALVEARDFASGSSSRSSKLVHGGLRYLEQFDFRLVRESRCERRLLVKLAPHLAFPVPFVLPIYRGDPYFPLKVRVGLSIYDLLGNLGREDRHRMLSADEARRLVPSLRGEGLRGAALYHDSETDDARLTLENVLSAAEHGAVVANYAEVRALAVSAREAGGGTDVTAEAEDRLTGRRYEISARFWVNAAGPWVDQVRALAPRFDGSRTLRLTKGTHLIIPPIAGRYALLAAILGEDRVFLTIPWGNFTLLGTTDTDFEGNPANVQPDAAETAYLLNALNRVLREPVGAEQVLGGFAGLRALVIEPGRSPSTTTREYRFHRDPWAKNLVSICGGKLTTARALAEKLLDQIAGGLMATPPSPLGHHPSRRAPLPGGHTGPFESFVKSASESAARDYHLPLAVAERIVRTYGSRWPLVLEPLRDDKQLAERLPGTPTLLAAEVEFAIRHEMALTLEDFLLRRCGLNWVASTERELVPAVAEIFARRLGWNADQRQAAVDSFARCTAGIRDSACRPKALADGSGFGSRSPAPST